jgi:hypothetical protein
VNTITATVPDKVRSPRPPLAQAPRAPEAKESTSIEPTEPAGSSVVGVFKAQHGFWMQVMKNHLVGANSGTYLSTFKEGRGQHITALDTQMARAFGERLIALADQIESEAEANRLRNVR